MKNNLPLGKLGESLAEKYLRSLGYKVIEKNFHKGYSEIDLVCKEGNTLVFVEVKTRKSKIFGTPLEAITPFKLRSLIRATQYYKLLHPELPDSQRIDVVSITLKDNDQIDSLEHIKNITL